MSLPSTVSLQYALYKVLKKNPTITKFLGNPPRLYSQPPRDSCFPFITLGNWKTQNVSGDDDGALEHRLSLHVWSRHEGWHEIHALVCALREGLHDQDITLEDYRLVSLRVVFCDVFRAGDGRTLHGVVRLKALTEPDV